MGIRHPAVTLVLCVAAAGALISCTGDDDTSSDPPPTVPGADITADTAEPTSTSVAETTTTTTTTTTLNPVPTVSLATTPTTTLGLPPVTTLVPEVPANLLTPQQLDPNDPKNSRLILPEHLPVLEAYLSSIQTTTSVSSTWPINPDSPDLLAAALTPESIAAIQAASRGRLARGEVLDVSQGVTFRPYVVGPVTDTAVVLDCELAGHYWVKADTRELIPPNEIWPAAPGHVAEVGLRETFVLREGRWLSDTSEIYPAACS